MSLRNLSSFVLISTLAFASGLQKNTKLEVRLDQTLTSETAHVEDRFTATLDKDVRMGDGTILRKGSKAEGMVRNAESTFGNQRGGELDLELTTIVSDGQTYPLFTRPLIIAGRQGLQDPNARHTDAIQAVGGVVGTTPRGNSQPIPGTSVSVGGGDSGSQVILPPKTKLAFYVVSSGTPKP